MRGTTSYPPEILRKLQQTELEILDTVADLCARNNIQWFLDSGTALGAVRHKGFIPWDDDVDIGMLSDEYERFIQVAREELPEGYVLHVPGEGDYYAPAFSKICKVGTKFWTQETIDAGFDQGIFLDVFSYDPVSGNSGQRRRQFSGARRYTRMLYLYQTGRVSYPAKGPVGILLKAGFHAAHFVLSRVTDVSSLYQKYLQAIRTAGGAFSGESACFAYPSAGSVQTSIVASTVEADFEGRRYPVPGDYEGYLAWMYGETWTEIPPEAQRKSHAPLVLDFGDGRNALEAS